MTLTHAIELQVIYRDLRGGTEFDLELNEHLHAGINGCNLGFIYSTSTEEDY